jgi:hypothetical protein
MRITQEPRDNQKPPILRETGLIPMASLVHCGIAELFRNGLTGIVPVVPSALAYVACPLLRFQLRQR